ncbi:MAG: IS200/IS605 family transposase [Armatimonadota bacterium]
MRKTKAEIYLHFVWATKNRMPCITPDIERAVFRCIEEEAQRIGCTILALNGAPDHLHVVVKIPTRLSAAEFAHQTKGVSSHFMHDQLKNHEHVYWQEGYGVFSVSRSHLKRVIAYVEGQKQHHQTGMLWPEWEETDEEVV